VTAAQDRLVAATAEVRVGGGRTGSAVLVDDRHLLTAAHVVQKAVANPSLTVTLVFPGRSDELPVQIVPLQAGPGVDVAVLELPEDVAASVDPVTIMAGRRLPESVRVFGYPQAEKRSSGVWRGFAVSGRTTVGSVQLDWHDAGTLPGHSGGPVVDDTGALVGILVEGATRDGRFDRFVPVTQIEVLWPGLVRPWVYAGENARRHALQRATGQPGQVPGADLFQGRESALAKIRSWLTAEESPWHPLVITGQPGAGKSAVLAHAALTAEGDPHLVYGVVVHARNATAGVFTEAIAGAAGVDAPADPSGLVGLLAELEDPGRLVVMVDALDEAASVTDRSSIASLLDAIAHLSWTRVVVTTRPLSDADRYYPGRLLPTLGAHSANSDNLVDLDTNPYADPDALARYAGALLAQGGATRPGPPGAAWTAYREHPAATDRLAAVIAHRAAGNFLVVALTADLLSQHPTPLDPDTPGFNRHDLPTTVGKALDKYLRTLKGRRRIRVKALLTGLAFAHGTGITDPLWCAFSSALGYHVEQTDLDLLRDSRASDYLFSTSSDDTGRVTRLFHQALIDQLLHDKARHHHQAIYRALMDHVHDTGGWQRNPYAAMHAADHAADAGTLPELLDDLDYLAHADMGRLAGAIEDQPPSERPPMAAVVRSCANRMTGLDSSQRLALLALSAAHIGLPELRQRLNRKHPHGTEVRWAQGRGAPHRSLTGHASSVFTVAFGTGPDGRPMLASGGRDMTVRLWDPVTGQSIGSPLKGHEGAVHAVAFGKGPRGRPLLASASHDRTVRLWDPGTGKPTGKPLYGHRFAVYVVAFGEGLGGRPLLASGGEKTIRLWDPATGDMVGAPIAGHNGRVNALVFGALPDGRSVLASAASYDPAVRLWDPTTHDPVGDPLNGHTSPVTWLAFGTRPDGRPLLASGSQDWTVRLWDPSTGESVGRPLRGHTARVNSVEFGTGPDGRLLLASAGNDRRVRLWDPSTGEPVGRPLTGHTSPVQSVALGSAPDGSPLLASASNDRTVRLWDPDSGHPTGDPLKSHAGPVNDVAIGNLTDGRSILASASNDRTVRLWDPHTGHPIGNPLTGHSGSVESVAFGTSRHGRPLLASASKDHTIRLWDLDTGHPLGAPLGDHRSRVNAVAFGTGTDDRPLLATASADMTVRLWDPDTGHPIGNPLRGHTDRVNAVAFGTGTNGRPLLATASADMTVRLWDPDTGHPIGNPLRGHTNWVNAVAFGTRTNGRPLLASAGDDKTIRLWDPDTGDALGSPLEGHGDWVVSVVSCASEDGRSQVISVGRDRTVRLWDSETHTSTGTIDLLDDGSALECRSNKVYVAAGRSLIALTLGG
jgi:WD40 repeat protein